MADENLTAENFKGEEVMLEIDNIILHPDLQQRDLSHEEDKKEYKKWTADVVDAVQDKDDIERVLVVRIVDEEVRPDGVKIKAGDYLCEGWRRVAGFKAAGRSKIPVLLRIGQWVDAVDVSTSANIKNLALPRKPADKRRAVESSLVNHFDWSDRKHSEHVKVSQELVAKVRPEVEKYLKTFANGKEIDTTTRVGKGGKRQAAKKGGGKAAKKAKKMIDWSGWEGPFGSLVRFIDHVGEMTLTEEEKKGADTDYQKAHSLMKGVGVVMQRWAKSKPKVIVS